MTPDEYKTWANYHNRCFPDFGRWWLGLAQDERETLGQNWRSILSRINLADACEATDRMLGGAAELCPAWERSMLAARIASIAREVAAERYRDEPLPQARRTRPVGSPARQTLEELERRVATGESHYLVLAELLPKPSDGRRYSCIRCLDSGYVRVWSVRAMRAVIDKTIDQAPNRTTMTCPCDCHRGDGLCIGDDERPPKQWHGYRESQRYSVDRYCRCTGEPDDPRCIDELREWVQDQIQRRAEPVTSGVFRQWNET